MCVNTCVARLPMWKQINTLNELTHVFEVVGMVGWGGVSACPSLTVVFSQLLQVMPLALGAKLL